jgi:tetratricopeptide (TPR) repeat protein
METAPSEVMDPFPVFISYSGSDGTDFAAKLRDNVKRVARFDPWIYPDRTIGYRFTLDLENKVQNCELLLFIATRNSLESDWCDREISLALRLGKRVIPLRVHDVKLPIKFEELPPVDFTNGWQPGWNELHRQLILINSPAERLVSLKHEHSSLRREASQATGSEQQRIENDLAVLEQKIHDQQRLVNDPRGAIRLSEESIDRGQERERAGEAPSADLSDMRCVNDPPPLFPNKFRDRAVETQLLEDRLRDPMIRFVAVVGRGGIGKTAMISQWRESLQRDRDQLPVDAFVYLSAYGARPIRPTTLLDDLRKTIPDRAAAARLAEGLNDPTLTLAEKLNEVLNGLGDTSTIVVIDDAEVLLDTQKRFRDPELEELVGTLVRRNDHGVKLIFVTRDEPEQLLRANPVRASRLPLDNGLPPADAYSFLRSLDSEGTFGLRSAPEEQLERVRRLTDGNPRALEALYAILNGERNTTLLMLLSEMDQIPPSQNIAEFLIRRSFDRLDTVDRRVIQALAAYRWPVRSSAVDYLLQWYLAGHMSETVMRRLMERRLVRQVGELFYLPPSPDGEWVLAGIPKGSPDDRDLQPPPLSQLALWHWAAEYFVGARKTRVECVDDLAAELSEIDLRMRGGEYQAALRLMFEIDNEYLDRWGHSDALVSWREELVDNLNDQHLEMHNLSWLASARRQQDDQQRAIESLGRALEIAQEQQDTINQIRIQIDLGSAHYSDGRISRAAELYEQARGAAHEQGRPRQEAKAREGLSLCLAETGQFQPALMHLAAALGIVETLQDAQRQSLEAELLLNHGWVYRQMGQSQDALDALERGQRLARQLDEPLLQGQFLGGQAEVLIGDGDWESAILLARAAVAIGAQTRNIHLLREANRTLALAYLCGGDAEAACEAAESATRNRLNHRALGALAIKGVAAYRAGTAEMARMAFLETHDQARMLRDREDRNFQVLDTDGLALCGLVMIGDQEKLRPAIAAYRAAREVTSAPGAVRRSLLLFDKLTLGWDPDTRSQIRRVASGH